jgi:hypothetical protein
MTIKEKDPVREEARREYKNIFGIKPVFMTTTEIRARVSEETKRRTKPAEVQKSSTSSMKEAMLRAGVVP